MAVAERCTKEKPLKKDQGGWHPDSYKIDNELQERVYFCPNCKLQFVNGEAVKNGS